MQESQVHRRFFQFILFRDALIQKYPGLFIPPLPQKLTKQHTSQAGNSLRQEVIYLLNRFLQSVASQPLLLESKEFELFMNFRRTADFTADIKYLR
jgi:hypothetical protein